MKSVKKNKKANKSLRIRKISAFASKSKKSVLEKYFEKGYLRLANSPFSDEDRKKVGEMLALDYYIGSSSKVKSINLENERVQSFGAPDSENKIFHLQRYHDALRHVPREFHFQLYIVCIEDKELKADNDNFSTECYNKYNIYHQKMLLTLGLERLVRFYLQKNKKSS